MKKIIASLGILAMLIVVSFDAILAFDGECKVVCPNSGVECVHQESDGTTTWSEKGASDPAVVEGPCDEVLEN